MVEKDLNVAQLATPQQEMSFIGALTNMIAGLDNGIFYTAGAVGALGSKLANYAFDKYQATTVWWGIDNKVEYMKNSCILACARVFDEKTKAIFKEADKSINGFDRVNDIGIARIDQIKSLQKSVHEFLNPSDKWYPRLSEHPIVKTISPELLQDKSYNPNSVTEYVGNQFGNDYYMASKVGSVFKWVGILVQAAMVLSTGYEIYSAVEEGNNEARDNAIFDVVKQGMFTVGSYAVSGTAWYVSVPVMATMMVAAHMVDADLHYNEKGDLNLDYDIGVVGLELSRGSFCLNELESVIPDLDWVQTAACDVVGICFSVEGEA